MDEDKKKLDCPVCNHKARYYNKLKEVTLYYCNNCQHRFTDVESIKIKETYSQDYFEEKHSNWFTHPNFQLFDYIFDRIKSTGLNSPSVLDTGCGNGDLLIQSKSISFNEIDHIAVAWDCLKYPTHMDNFRKKELQGRTELDEFAKIPK